MNIPKMGVTMPQTVNFKGFGPGGWVPDSNRDINGQTPEERIEDKLDYLYKVAREVDIRDNMKKEKPDKSDNDF